MESEKREFEEVLEEEVIETEKESELEVKDGIVIYQTDTGSLGYNYLGNPTLKDVTYYLRLLEEITEDLWKNEFVSRDESEGKVNLDA